MNDPYILVLYVDTANKFIWYYDSFVSISRIEWKKILNDHLSDSFSYLLTSLVSYRK